MTGNEPYRDRNGTPWNTIGTRLMLKHIRFPVVRMKHLIFVKVQILVYEVFFFFYQNDKKTSSV